MPNPTARPMAQPPAPAPAKFRPKASAQFSAPLALQAKRQEHFQDEAVDLAAAYGWAGDPAWVLNGIRVEDAQNFIRKTLHEIHVSHCNDHLNAPDYAAAAAHLGLNDADATAFVAALTASHDREHTELKGHDWKKLEAKLAANQADDKAERDRVRTSAALGA
jgi:hypothetical protein